MTQSPDHPELLFIQARYYQVGRPSGPPLWIVAHTMEAGEASTRAETTAAYFADPGDGRFVSSHYCADNNSIVCCVRLSDTAFTVGNIGNQRGINWEFAGFAAQTAAQWGDSYSMAMLRRAAPYWYADAERYGIPIRRLSIAELQQFKRGLTSHNDLRLAFGGTTHTDPGPHFPWDEFIEMINGGGGVSEAEVLAALINPEDYRDPAVRDAAVAAGRPTQASLRGLVEIAGGAVLYGLNAAPVAIKAAQFDALVAKLDAMDEKLDQIITALAAGGGGGEITVSLSGQISGTLTNATP